MKICYINFTNSHTRDKVTIKALRENDVGIIEITDDSFGWKKFSIIRNKLKEVSDYDLIIVGYTGALLVPWIWFITTKKKIVYNALASLYEGMIVSRVVGSMLSLSSLKYFAIDWMAFRLADLAIVETQKQKEYVQKLYRIKSNKLSVQLSGVDNSIFYFDPTIKKLPNFTVLFRGKFTQEAGVDILLHAARKLEKENADISFRILGHGFLQEEVLALVEELNLKNVEIVTEYLADDIIRTKMLECHLAIGQLSNHPRLDRTIPFKAFESLAMRLPYLTARNAGVLELVKEDVTCLCFNPGDAEDLANKILFASENPKILETISSNGYTLFRDNLTPKALGQKLLLPINALK